MTLAEARKLYASKFKPNPTIYWSDFLASSALAWVSLWIAVGSEPYSPIYLIATLVGIFVMLRAVLFIHELSHLKAGSLPYFEFGYNLVFGIPFMAPSLLYTGSHGDHHRQNLFGTLGDPEYAPIATWSAFRIFVFTVAVAAAPLLLALRFAVFAPISWLLPPVRRLLIAKGSALVINNAYDRPIPKGRDLQLFTLQEIGAAFWAWTVAALIYSDVISARWFFQWLIVAAGTLLVNQVRTLAAHRYINEGNRLTVEEQLLDSINLDGGSVLTALAAPVGLRFHALHHFLPNVPYHALPALHKALLKELPLESSYRATCEPGILSTVAGLFVRQTPHHVKRIESAIEADNGIKADKKQRVA